MITESQRAEVVRVARSFIGTPYHHMGRVKGAGVDCATLLAEVYYEAGVLKEPVAIEYYPMDWHLHRDDERYLQMVQRYCREIPAERVAPGDIVIYHFGRAWSHGGIVIDVRRPGEHVASADPREQSARAQQRSVAEPLQITIVHALVNQNVQLADGERDGVLVGRKRRCFSPVVGGQSRAVESRRSARKGAKRQ